MSKSEIDDLISKSKNTGIFLEEILKNLSETSIKTTDDFLLHKSTVRTEDSPTSENNEENDSNFISNNILVLMKHIDVLLSELFYETIEYHKMSQSLSAFVSEAHLSPEKMKKTDILKKLGIRSKYDNEKISENLRLPIIYFIIFYFMSSIKEDYQKVLNTFYNRQNDIVNKCEECIIKNTSKEPRNSFSEQADKINSIIINNKLSDQEKDLNIIICVNVLHKINKSISKQPTVLEKIQEETHEDKLNNSNDEKEIKRDSIDQEMFGPDLDFADRRTRAQSVKKKMFVPKKFIGVEDDTKKEFKEIKETVKRESIRKKSLNNNSNIINTLAALKVDFIKIDTDEDKLKKMEKCPFIEQIEIYY